MAVLTLTVPLLLATVTFDLTLNHLKGSPISIISPSRNVTFSIVGNSLLADQNLISPLDVSRSLSLSVHCLSDTSLHISSTHGNALIHSPSICSKAYGLLVNEESLYGCVSNVYLDSRLLAERICGNNPDETSTIRSTPKTVPPVYVAQPLEVNEGGAMPLQWKNVYVLPEHSKLNITNKQIIFSVVENPQHGQLLIDGKPTSLFHYGQLLARNVIYKHDGSETKHDSLEFQLEINNKNVQFPWLETTTYTLEIKINAVNDAPEIAEVKVGNMIPISAKGSRDLSTDILRLADVDDGPDKVLVQVVEARGVQLRVEGKVSTEFTQRQMLNRQVVVHDEGIYEKSVLRLVARDGDQRSQVATLTFVSTRVEVRLAKNTGIKLFHQTSQIISNYNLSFTSSVPNLPLLFSLVELPVHGVVECSSQQGNFAVCSKFTQEQIDQGLVRFRHTNNRRPNHDVFSFQVEAGEFLSMIHNFRVMFVPMNVKVFNRDVFMLNGSDTGHLTRSNLFAWTFPKSYSPEKLVYHVEEPPKFGILSRKVGGKNRRIGVSSNFTQRDIDDGLIIYRIHFMQYTIVNDFLLFRVIAPSVTSETLRFEVVFVPPATSIQLVNRTIIAREGDTAQISSDSLSLTTSDDKHFAFIVNIPPKHGNILLQTENGHIELSTGMNFTTTQIIENRLFYAHSGDESREDKAYILAESVFKAGRRIPFWLSFSVILENDNPPRLRGKHVILMVERGERILHPHLLDWVDDDVDGLPLEFDFSQPMKDAAVLSTVSPHLPMTSFALTDLQNANVMIRHLGHRSNFTLRYTVSDGLHRVRANVTIVATEPFVQMEYSAIEYCCLPGDTPQILITAWNLSVSTNLDVKPEEIVYSALSNQFLVETNNTRTSRHRFTQKDIDTGHVWYRVSGVESETLAVKVADKTLKTQFFVTLRSTGVSLELRKVSPPSVAIGAAVVMDKDVLDQGDGVNSADKLQYRVTKLPTEGQLVLQPEGAKMQLMPLLFTQQDVDLGRLQYVHTGSGSGRDSIEFSIASPHATKGPFTLFFDIYEHQISMMTSALTVLSGASTVISTATINVTSSDKDDYVIEMLEQPSFGWIVKDSWSTANLSSLEKFTGAELRERRILFVSDRISISSRDQFALKACISESTCTEKSVVTVFVSRRNVQSPQILRNEVLRLSSDKALITNSHLDSEDPDTATSGVFFLISKPSNGMIVSVHEMDTPIYNFSQKDIDDNIVAFVKNSASSGSGGFSFLLSDGVHQVGPEWFSIEGWSSSSPALETNTKLVLAPKTTAVIGIDHLRANLPNSRPSEVLFSIVRAPRYGVILLDGKPTNKFRQSDVNSRLVSFESLESHLDWSRKDFFSFVLQRNASARAIKQEFRFRILTTYAAIQGDELDNYVSISPLQLSKGGSSALNPTNFNLDSLVDAAQNEVLLVEVGKGPRHGSLVWLDGGRGLVSWSEIKRGITAIYRHTGDSLSEDSLQLFIYPLRETTKRSSRLRIHVPIKVVPVRDPLVQVTSFPRFVSVLNSASAALDPHEFLAVHPHVPPQSIVYEVIETGRIGTTIRVKGREKRMFSQEELSRGEVTVSHFPVPAAASSSDVIVLSVEGHSRALEVRIRPLDLSLENHTIIEYPQGKTYVVLNRYHLGAYSNGDRDKITYKVTSGPENGTFYWVAGEKEAKQFTQLDIDEGKVLYAQLNMHSYRDSFEFVMSNDDKDVVRNRSEIKVKALVDVQPVIVETGSATILTPSQLNASGLQGSTPRFLVVSTPVHGRITLDPTANHSALFFTYPDVLRGRVHYQPFHTNRETLEKVELEVRADSVQPARLILPITILPLDDSEENRDNVEESDTIPPKEVPRMVPISDKVPVGILAGIMLITVIIVIWLNRKKKPKEEPRISLTPPPRLPPTPPECVDKPDLLGSTVFASVGGRSERNTQPMKSFEVSKPQPMSKVTKTPSMKRRHQPSLDYAGLTGDAPPPMPLFKQLAAKQSDTQYWV